MDATVTKKFNEIDALRLTIASPEMIREWSYGEVTESRYIGKNRLPDLPDGTKRNTGANDFLNGGLFCQKIFGPVKDYRCMCGRYNGRKYKGIICEDCGVEVTAATVRRERMGHIELAVPVANFLFLRGGYIAEVLSMNRKEVDDVVYCEKYVVTESSVPEVTVKSTFTIDVYDELSDRYGDAFVAETGAKAVKKLLEEINPEEEARKLREEYDYNTGPDARKKIMKRLRLLEAFIDTKSRPEWMIMDVIPVMPPDLRPHTVLGNGRQMVHDLNALYTRVLIQNESVKGCIERCVEEDEPEEKLNTYCCKLQKSVDALIYNEKCDKNRIVKKSNSRTDIKPYKSLMESLSGKKGRFRSELAGKRVDYSGRTVIVVGPELKINQCGLPKDMALELFLPFVIHGIIEAEFTESVSEAKKMIRIKDERIWNVLQDVIKDRTVILNRQPTLHKVSALAFNPVLIDGKAIRLHPLTCTGFNADFDGDQMACHVALSEEAQKECREIMLSTKNLIKPSDGEVITVPSQDMVLGVYYLTMEKNREYGEKKAEKRYCQKDHDRNIKKIKEDLTKGLIKTDSFIKIRTDGEEEIITTPKDILGRRYADAGLAMTDYDAGIITLQQPIYVYREGTATNGEKTSGYVRTTLGRIIFNTIIPQDLGFVDREKAENAHLPEINGLTGKKEIKRILNRCMAKHGTDVTVEVLDGIKTMGYKYSTLSGITISVEDMTIPADKKEIIEKTQKLVQRITELYGKGHLTEDERYHTVTSLWDKTDKEITKLLMQSLGEYNNLFIMADSGARGSEQQIKQLVGMRGLMADTTGKVIEQPIKSCFREGLNPLEYFMSAHGARKGMSDTALRTSDSGYLTRRLVCASHDVIIRAGDCCADGPDIAGMYVSALTDGNGITETLKERITGRYTAEALYDAKGEVIVEADTLITPGMAEEIISRATDHNGVKVWDDEAGRENPEAEIRIRTVITCRSARGICAKCYGVDNATKEPVKKGSAVGIIAAQSIGEPGTQLTMRTFHTGGVAGAGDITQGLPRVEELLEARELSGSAVLSEMAGRVELSVKGKRDVVTVLNDTDKVFKEYKIPYGMALKVKNGDNVKRGDSLTEGPCNLSEIMRLKGTDALCNYILKEVQKVYRMQGIEISDKHIEIIIRKMLGKVKITSPGDSGYNEGDEINYREYVNYNRLLADEGLKPVKAERLILGLKKITKKSDSFLTSAVFEEQSNNLAKAAVFGKTDLLEGIMENTVMGLKIPVGTGYRN